LISDRALYALLADATLLTHAAYVLFVVAGQFLIVLGWFRNWNWTRNVLFRALHLVAIGFVVVEAGLGAVCPLTVLEQYLRAMAGEAGHEMSFMAYWTQRLLFYNFPVWVFTLVYSIFFLLVTVTFFAYPPRRVHRRGA